MTTTAPSAAPAPGAPQPIARLLIANRGEIAVRIAATCRRLGVRSIAVYTEVDAGSAHVAAADEAVSLGPDPRAYLDVRAIVDAASASGADAVHPGYGFLSENAELARACSSAGLVFVGPSAEVIDVMGSKINAKAVAVRAGVPIVPGRAEPGLSDADLLAAVEEIGVPVLLKASAGGGGKGMRVVGDLAEVPAAIASARREAAAAFGDDALMVERFVAAPRHIEVQILGDRHGAAAAIADRECSLQRRHQKVVEEAPVTSLPEPVRQAIAADAVAIAKAVGYVGAGTVEFIVDGADLSRYYFLEMNTRLQVEHPVTEAVTGLDLVAWQLAIAEGASLDGLQVQTDGVAVEARIYAEDPANGFLPTGGRLLVCELAAGAARVDSGVRPGDDVSSHYDPMLAKVIAHGPDRPSAYRALRSALQAAEILGVTTNLGYLGRLLADPRVLRNEVHTRWIDEQQELAEPVAVPPIGIVAAALDRWLPPVAQQPGPHDPWEVPSGWRMGEYAWTGWRFRSESGTHDVLLRAQRSGRGIEVRVDGPDAVGGATGLVEARRRDGAVEVAVLQASPELQAAPGIQRVAVAHDGDRAWIGQAGQAWVLQELSRLAADRADETSADLAPVRSPMPGTVIAVAVSDGTVVAPGDALVTVEAMKMEHTLRAAADGTVGRILVAVGDRVALDQDLVRWEVADA